MPLANVNTAIICPLDLEYRALAGFLSAQGWRFEEAELRQAKGTLFPEQNLLLAHGGHGKVQFALRTQMLLFLYPSLTSVICAGVAGALVPELQTGDVILGTETVEHDFNLKFISRPRPNFPGAVALLARAAPLADELLPFAIHRGLIASGDEDIIDCERARELHQQTGAVAVAWEGAGGARACRHHQKDFLEARAITDAADHRSPEDFARQVRGSMENLGQVMLRLI